MIIIPSTAINWNLLSLVIGLLGLLSSIFFFFKSRKSKKPVYRCRTARVIQRNVVNQINDLEVFYDGQKLPALTISKIAIWNDGSDTISDTDLSTTDVLRVEIDKQYEILSCEILTQSKPANNFSFQISKDHKSVVIRFAYLDFQEGVVLKVRHTGANSTDLQLKGSIKTVKEIQRIMAPVYMKRGNPEYRLFVWTLSVLVASLFGYSIFSTIRYFYFAHGSLRYPLIAIIVGVVYGWLLIKFIQRPVSKSLTDVFINEDF